MVFKNFIQNRRSVRLFQTKYLDDDMKSSVNNAIERVLNEEKSSGIDIKPIYSGFEVYNELDGKAGYSGIMIKAPAYISLKYKEINPANKIYGSFQMEKLITKLIGLGLDICWITLEPGATPEKVKLFGDDAEFIEYVVAIGYAEEKKPFTPEATSGRKEVTEIVFGGEPFNAISGEELDRRGLLDIFSSIRFAPSHKNLQPWKFVVSNDKLSLYILDDENIDISLSDAGIIMYYFYELAHGLGIKSEWEICDLNTKAEDYVLLAEYKL